MNRRRRLIFLGLALILLIIVGRTVTASFEFLLKQFWFTAGLFLLILLSLIDQPFFSKDSNIFVNGVTAWVSLLLVSQQQRDVLWWFFFLWVTYLIVSSYVLMWRRSKELFQENNLVQLLSRLNRQIGRPEAIFSAFFLWGCIKQFGAGTREFNALFLYWVIFTIINLPAISQALDSFFEKSKLTIEHSGKLGTFLSPRIAQIIISPSIAENITGKRVSFKRDDVVLAEGVVIDDRTMSKGRIGRVALTLISKNWTTIAEQDCGDITISVEITKGSESIPISVVDVGTEIGKIEFFVHPDATMQEGEVLWVETKDKQKTFYQIVSAEVRQHSAMEGNSLHVVRVTAGQLGYWDQARCHFYPITWVPPAGNLIYKTSPVEEHYDNLPEGHIIVGKVPNSNFPIHLNINETITHNTAIIGVTGSGKSYLGFHLVESMVGKGIKILVLDISSQYQLFLGYLKPTILKNPNEVCAWFDSNSKIAIYQFDNSTLTYPTQTSQFVEAAFQQVSRKNLKVGKDEPASLCIIFEEAHSLIPEWNQVSVEGDKAQVNKTARIILQGRKYGLGSLIITQRTANVTKTILNQCNTIFALQSFDQTGLDFLKNYMGEEYSHAISTLQNYRAILVGKASSSTRPIIFCIEDFTNRWKAEDLNADVGKDQKEK